MKEFGLKSLFVPVSRSTVLRPHQRTGHAHRRYHWHDPSVAALSKAGARASYLRPRRRVVCRKNRWKPSPSERGQDGGGYEESGRKVSSEARIACWCTHSWFGTHGQSYSGFPGTSAYFAPAFLHDIGYLHRAEMDGPNGEEHVVLGARIMGWLFGPEWADECYRHSRYWSKRMGLPVSRLCLADKLAFAITPAWMYIPMARWTGELDEYMQRSKERQAGDQSFTDEEITLLNSGDPHAWLRGLQSYTLRWVEQHHVEFLKDRSIRATPLKQSSSPGIS